MKNLTASSAALIIEVLVAIVTLGLITYLVIAGHDVPAVVTLLLGLVTGFLGHYASSAQGASQALSTGGPPGPPSASDTVEFVDPETAGAHEIYPHAHS
jgi:hypothetical protein